MCWSAPVSFGAFIIGTALNIWLINQIREPMIIGLAVFWEWIIFMQLFEGLYWSRRNSPNGASQYPSIFANINSILQPIAFLIILLVATSYIQPAIHIQSSQPSPLAKSIAAIIGIIYLGYVVYTTMTVAGIKSLEPLPGCQHLNISWANVLPGTSLLYLIALISIGILLIRPIKFMLMIMAYVILGLLVSGLAYPCGLASMWCFFSVLGPLVTYFAWKYGQ